MTGIGTIVNVAAILVGGVLGLLLKSVLSTQLVSSIKQALGLGVLVVGISGLVGAIFKIEGDALSSNYILLIIISLASGTLIGSIIKIEERFENLSRKLEAKAKKPDKDSTFTEAFVTTSLLFCIGAMAIFGPLEDGLNNDPSILFAKSTLDGISAMVFASVLGAGVLFSVIPLGIYQGAITALAVLIAPYLTYELTLQISAVGSALIIGMGLNMLEITKMKIGNFIPAIFIPIIYYLLQNLYHAIF